MEVLIIDVSGKILYRHLFSDWAEPKIGGDLKEGFYFLEVRGKTFREVIPIVNEK